MKNLVKLFVAVVVLTSIVTFTSCTDLEEQNAKHEDLFNIDRGDVVRPGDQGGN